MLTRNLVLFCLFILVVDGDIDSDDAGIQAMSRDLTSDEAPTESIKAISPDQPAAIANQETAPQPAAAAANSVEEEHAEDESSDSEEGGKRKFSSRSAKPQLFIQSQQPPLHIHWSPALPPISPAHDIQSPTLLPQPIVPQPKALARSRTSKRRSRNNRRQI